MAEHMWYERAQELEAENARLRAELAAERERADFETAKANGAGRALIDVIEKNAKLREALEPFAEAARSLDYKYAKWLDHEIHWCVSAFVQMPTVGDLRRARAVLAETGGGDE